MQERSNDTLDTMLALKREFLMPCVFHFFRKPMVLERGEGCRLYDTEGRAYLDCYSGVGVTNCGHGQSSIIERAVAQLRRLVHTTTIYLTAPMLRLAESLAKFIGGGPSKTFFCTSGSEANETALLLAKLATGRSAFISLSRSLHGRTWLTSGITGMAFWRSDPDPPSNVHFVPAPTCGDCPLKLAYPSCGLACADAVGEVLARHPNEIAALIAEPVQGNGGINVPPPGYFERVQAHLREHGALLVMDEAQTGFCRTGRRFGHQHWNVQPDMITVCKALANGLPIAGLVATPEVAAAYTKPGASTFGGNLVCASAALATLDFMREHRLEDAAEARGRRLRAGLDALALRQACVKEVRGLGLMLGMELVDAAGEPAGALLDDILEALKDRGVLAGKTGPGRNVLTLMPPLVITEEEIDTVLATLDTVFDAVAGGRQGAA